jgi:hypothetical protein
MTNVFSVGRGIIYTIDQQGNLWWHRHVGYQTGDPSWEEKSEPVGWGWIRPGFQVVANNIVLHG